MYYLTYLKCLKLYQILLNIRGLRVALARPERLPLAGCFPGPAVSQSIDGAVAVAAPLAPETARAAGGAIRRAYRPPSWSWPSLRLSHQATLTSWEGRDGLVRPPDQLWFAAAVAAAIAVPFVVVSPPTAYCSKTGGGACVVVWFGRGRRTNPPNVGSVNRSELDLFYQE